MAETISKHIAEGFGKGELYAALAYDSSDVFGGMKIKALMLNSTGRISFLDATSYIYSSVTTQLDIVSTTIALAGICSLTGATTITGAFGVTGAVTLTGAVTIAAANTFTSGTGAIALNGDITIATTKKAQFRDTATYISSSGANVLDIVAPTLTVTATTAVTITTPTTELVGSATVPAIKLSGAGSKSAADYAAAGTAWADAGTPAFIADQMYARVYIGATIYRLPLWADA